MLSEEKKTFLDLPQSELALKLAKRSEAAPKPSFGQRIWSSRKWLLGASALIAGLAPLYELNVAAINFVQTQIRVRNLLDAAESLLAIDAREATDEQLKNARALAPNNLRLQEIQALLDLEATLRLNQDRRSLQTIEIRYAKTLPTSARASYLLGTAYIGVDLKRAEDLLVQASSLQRQNDYPLALKIESAWIWLYVRRINLDSDEKWLAKADEAFKRAMTIASERPADEVLRSLIPLHQHASFVEELRAKRGDEKALSRALSHSEKALALAVQTGSHLLIGKTASGLAEKYKDAERFDDASALIAYAIENATVAGDDRGLYHDRYTLGQIEFDRGKFEIAKKHFDDSQASSIKHNDLRMQIFNAIYLAKICIVTGDSGAARRHLARSAMLAEISGDKYGRVETKFLELLLRGAETPRAGWSALSNDIQKLHPEAEVLGLSAGPIFWTRYFRGEAKRESYGETADVYDKAFEEALLKILQPADALRIKAGRPSRKVGSDAEPHSIKRTH